MSFCYTIPKQGFNVAAWQGRISELLVDCDPGKTPPGVWREMLLSNMIRSVSSDSNDISARYLVEGSIRGVLVSDHGNSIDIIINSFASYTDQILAAQMAKEAMQLGAIIEKEGYGEIDAAELDETKIKAFHSEWFAFSKAILRSTDERPISWPCTIPIYEMLSLTIEADDAALDTQTLEEALIAKLARVGDAFLSSEMTVGIDGKEVKASILQPDMKTLMFKDIDVVFFERELVPLDHFISTVGSEIIDGGGSWVMPTANSITPAQSAALLSSRIDSQAKSGPSDADWEFIAQGPVLAFLVVAAADGKVDKKELETFARVLGLLAAQQEHPGVSRMMAGAIQGYQNMIPKFIQGKADAVQVMRAFTILVDDSFDTDDAKVMKMALIVLAQRVAEASGGFFGFGPKISKNEKQAIGVLWMLLGLDEE